jgi:putative transposase
LGAAAGGVRVAKVGDVRLAHSRALPAVPSGVTVIRATGGRHCAYFVVQVAATPLPATTSDVGIDLGLTRLAVLSAGEVIENLGQLRPGARSLARAQRAPVAKAKGRSGVPGRQVGLLSAVVRSPRPAWTHTTGWPTA